MTRLTRRCGFALLLFLCGAAGSAALADPPGRVGRLGEMTGQVWLYTPDAGEWVTAVRNRPITSGDRLSTDTSARAELRIGSTTVRLDAGTELEVLAIDDDEISLQLHDGSIAARLRSTDAAREFELRTADGRFTVHRAGRYRFDRRDDASHVTVWSGEALYEGPGSALTVERGQRAEFWIDRSNAAQYSITEPAHDAFASWNRDRDHVDERSASSRYVSPEMTGAEDLDRYGRWEHAPEYGTVWVPRHVPYGWVPYGAGHWTWVSPWGWTWVDDMPWGFAPFHYGRWAMFNHRWCWVPGRYVRRPVYAPALVGWLGGPRLSVSISFGSRHAPAVGWFPLAPREVYVPAFRASPGYVQQVNVTHVTNITNVTTIVNNPTQAVGRIEYRNRRHHAVTVVPETVFRNREPVATVAASLRSTPVVRQVVSEPAPKVVVSAPAVRVPPAAKSAETRRRFDDDGDVRTSPGRAAPAPRIATQPQAVAMPDVPATRSVATPPRPQTSRSAPPVVVTRTTPVAPPSQAAPPVPSRTMVAPAAVEPAGVAAAPRPHAITAPAPAVRTAPAPTVRTQPTAPATPSLAPSPSRSNPGFRAKQIER